MVAGLRYVIGVTKEYGSSWIFELCLIWANALQRVQRSAFSLVCALIAPAAAPLSTSAVLAVVAAAVRSDAHLPPAVGQREADLRRERRVVGAEVGEEGVPARPCHGDCDPPQSLRALHPSSPKRSAFTTRPPAQVPPTPPPWSGYATGHHGQ